MNRKLVLMLTLTLLIGMLNVAFRVQGVEASGTIYIRADGSIDPPTANITTTDYVTYTFTGNINDSIVVEKDNIIVDGAGHILEGFNSGYGFSLYGRVNVTIKKLHIANFEYGIYMNNSNGNSVTHNNITNNNYGVSLGYSTNNNVLMNEISQNSYGINGRFFSSENNIIGNTVGNNARNGIEFYGWDFSENLIISNNTVIGNGWAGLWLVSSANNNTVSSNYVAGNGYSGIELHSSSGNIIMNNTITDNADNGILVESSENTIIENSITLNHRYGLELVSSNNTVFNNSFEGNARTPQVYASGSTGNSWDNGYPSGGNYWSDYSGVDQKSGPYQNQTGSDGIGDTPYVIDANNTDHYPLMSKPVIPEFPSFLILPLFFIATLLAVTVHRQKQRKERC
jgi:parallel beta-helix repeat protein